MDIGRSEPSHNTMVHDMGSDVQHILSANTGNRSGMLSRQGGFDETIRQYLAVGSAYVGNRGRDVGNRIACNRVTSVDLIFDATRFLPRGHCGDWHTALRLLYQWSNLAITGAYVAIPLAMFVVDVSWSQMYRSLLCRCLFAGFITSCGLGHLEHVIVFQWPAYHLFAIWSGLTAVISWATVAAMVSCRKVANE